MTKIEHIEPAEVLEQHLDIVHLHAVLIRPVGIPLEQIQMEQQGLVAELWYQEPQHIEVQEIITAHIEVVETITPPVDLQEALAADRTEALVVPEEVQVVATIAVGHEVVGLLVQ